MKNKNSRSQAGGIKTDGRRVSRVEKEVQSVVSQYIIRNLQSELPGLVTVGRVQIPADLRQARVYVSLLNINTDVINHEQLNQAVKTLQSWAPEIQNEIGHQLKMKYLPKLTFFADESTEKILKIEKLLADIHHPDEDED